MFLVRFLLCVALLFVVVNLEADDVVDDYYYFEKTASPVETDLVNDFIGYIKSFGSEKFFEEENVREQLPSEVYYGREVASGKSGQFKLVFIKEEKERYDRVINDYIKKMCLGEKLSLIEKIPGCGFGLYVLDCLARDEDFRVRCYVAMNSAVPYSTLCYLCSDEKQIIRIMAKNAFLHARTISSILGSTYIIDIKSLARIDDCKRLKSTYFYNNMECYVEKEYKSVEEIMSDKDRILSLGEDYALAMYASVTNAMTQLKRLPDEKNKDNRSKKVVCLELYAIAVGSLPFIEEKQLGASKQYAETYRRTLNYILCTDEIGCDNPFYDKLIDCHEYHVKEYYKAWDAMKKHLEEHINCQNNYCGKYRSLQERRRYHEIMSCVVYDCLFGDSDMPYFLLKRLYNGQNAQSFEKLFYEYFNRISLSEKQKEESLKKFKSYYEAKLEDEKISFVNNVQLNKASEQYKKDQEEIAKLFKKEQGCFGYGYPVSLLEYDVSPELQKNLDKYKLNVGWIKRDRSIYPRSYSTGDLSLQDNDYKMPYLIYMPSVKGKEKLPLVLYIGGNGELGRDLNLQFRQRAVFDMICSDEFQKKYPCYLYAPMFPKDSSPPGLFVRKNSIDTFEHIMLDALYELDRKGFAQIDFSRIYITGLSWGGFAAMHLAESFPNTFAASVPVSTTAFPDILKETNCHFWVLLNEEPKLHKVRMDYLKESKLIIEKNGGSLKWTTFPDKTHDAWTKAWKEPAVWEWCFSKRLDGKSKKSAFVIKKDVSDIGVKSYFASKGSIEGREEFRATDSLVATWYEGNDIARKGDVFQVEYDRPIGGILEIVLKKYKVFPKCKVEVSSNGKLWTTLGVVSSSTGVFKNNLNTSIRYVRVNVVSDSTESLKIVEISVR